MEHIIGNTRITIVTGDLTQQPDLDAIVNAANNQLRGGAGVCGAIFRAAGWDAMQKSCNEHTPHEGGESCPVGDVRVTQGHALPNRLVAHAVGPVYRAEDGSKNEVILARAYWNTLRVLDRYGVNTAGFPAISCGIFRYPLEEAATVALQTVAAYLRTNPHHDYTEIRFVFLPFGDGPEVQAVFEQALENLMGYPAATDTGSVSTEQVEHAEASAPEQAPTAHQSLWAQYATALRGYWEDARKWWRRLRPSR